MIDVPSSNYSPFICDSHSTQGFSNLKTHIAQFHPWWPTEPLYSPVSKAEFHPSLERRSIFCNPEYYMSYPHQKHQVALHLIHFLTHQVHSQTWQFFVNYNQWTSERQWSTFPYAYGNSLNRYTLKWEKANEGKNKTSNIWCHGNKYQPSLFFSMFSWGDSETFIHVSMQQPEDITTNEISCRIKGH